MLEKLAWDTDRLGINVGRILPDTLSAPQLATLLRKAQQNQLNLVYWCADPSMAPLALAHQGILVDNKRTYLIDLSAISVKKPPYEPVDSPSPDERLLEMAVEIGLKSRFSQDPLLTRTQMVSVYHEWMRNCCRKIAADVVLVLKDKGKIMAMVTLKMKGGRGDIGLLAVAADGRGQGLGTLITQSALSFYQQQGVRSVQVVTQQSNSRACHLYEKCGFTLENEQKFYHFWIK